MSLLGKEEKHNTNYLQLAEKLQYEWNLIQADIDRYLSSECESGKLLSFKVNDVKTQIYKLSTILTTHNKSKNTKETVRLELNNLELYTRNLEVEVNNLRSTVSDECQDKLKNIFDSLEKFRRNPTG